MPGLKPLYKGISNPAELATSSLSNAGKTYGNMTQSGQQKTDLGAAPKTVGGAVMSGVSMGVMGSMAGSAIGGGMAASAAGATAAGTAKGASVGGYWGAAIGAVVGLAAYYLS